MESPQFTFNIVPNSNTLAGNSYHHFLRRLFEASSRWSATQASASYSNIESKSRIKNKIPELISLNDKLGFHRFMQENDFKFYPKSFSVDEVGRMREDASYLVKPTKAACGNGIRIFPDAQSARNFVAANPVSKSRYFTPLGWQTSCGYIIQENMTSLDLISGSKYDIRCYLLAVCQDHRVSYFYHDGYARLTIRKFEKDSLDLTNVLTGPTLQGKQPGYDENRHVLTQQEFDSNGLRRQKIIQCFMQLCRVLPKRSSARNGLVLLGADVLFDKMLQPYLLELNHNPGFNSFRSGVNKRYMSLQMGIVRDLIGHFLEPMLLNQPVSSHGNFVALQADTPGDVEREAGQ